MVLDTPSVGKQYSGPPIPVTYDPLWTLFTNLTPEQVAAFQSFPQDLLKYAKPRRWLAETSGLTLNGIPIATQDRDQQKIAMLKQALDDGVLTGNIQFFDGAGNVQVMTPAQVTAMYTAVVKFVEATYDTAATVVAGIKAGTITTRKQIDAAYAAAGV